MENLFNFFFYLFFPPSIYSSILCVSWVNCSQDRVYGKEYSACPSADTESVWIGQRLLMNVVFLHHWYCPTAKPLCLKLSSGKPKPLRTWDKYWTFTVILCVTCVLYSFPSTICNGWCCQSYWAAFWGQINLVKSVELWDAPVHKQTNKHFCAACRKSRKWQSACV